MIPIADHESILMNMLKRVLFFLLLAAAIFLSPALSLGLGIAFALIFGSPYLKFTKHVSKYLLQAAVVGLGFGMNLHESLEVGRQGMLFTIGSVIGVMCLGYMLTKWLNIRPKLGYLISSGTAICGGSAIAAIAPVVNADENETSMSMAVIFTLNAVALFVFPPIGRLLEMTQVEFGTWAAIAIHDTSSVVGAGAAYGPEALVVATTVKLTRALWIIPLAFVSMWIFRQNGRRVSIPWFIVMFVAAMILNTYVPIPDTASHIISTISHRALSLTLFLIGSSLSIVAIRKVGAKPVMQGVILWIVISISTLLIILA